MRCYSYAVDTDLWLCFVFVFIFSTKTAAADTKLFGCIDSKQTNCSLSSRGSRDWADRCAADGFQLCGRCRWFYQPFPCNWKEYMLWANIRLTGGFVCRAGFVYMILCVIRSTSPPLFNVCKPVIDLVRQVFQIRSFIMLLQKRQSGIGS